MDREGDAYMILASLIEKERAFVIRSAHDRMVFGAEHVPMQLSELLESAPIVVSRSVPICRRPDSPKKTAKERKIHPPREGRTAKLTFSAGQIELRRTSGAPKDVCASIFINVVYVNEVDTPEDCVPVTWTLLTTEPIDTPEQILRIVDLYRARWTIEEFFKAIKTGCSYEKRQLESKRTLLNALAATVFVAWKLLLMRTLSRTQGELPATEVLTPTQITVLQSVSAKKMALIPTISEVFYAIARLGGHLKRNGPPGWLIIGRGYEKLLSYEVGWVAALNASSQPQGVA